MPATRNYNEIKDLGEKNSTRRTARQPEDVEAGVDAGVGDLLGIGTKTSETMGDAGSKGAFNATSRISSVPS